MEEFRDRVARYEADITAEIAKAIRKPANAGFVVRDVDVRMIDVSTADEAKSIVGSVTLRLETSK